MAKQKPSKNILKPELESFENEKAPVIETESEQKVLSEDELAQIEFKGNDVALKRYRVLRVYSALTHSEAINHCKRQFNIKVESSYSKVIGHQQSSL